MTQKVKIRTDVRFWRCFSPWGTSFLRVGAAACVEARFKPVCLWFPAGHSKSLSGQEFTLQDPGPCYLPSHLLSFFQAPQLHFTCGAVMNFACSPAPLPWHASSPGLGDSFRNLLHLQTSYHSKKHYLLILLQLREKAFPHKLIF